MGRTPWSARVPLDPLLAGFIDTAQAGGGVGCGPGGRPTITRDCELLMYLLNLSLVQFVFVFGSVTAVAVALYLLDRSRRRQVVSTLRFWVAAEQPAVAARRKRIQQPWSLILQLAGMALLLLAVGQLRLGSPAQAGRDHVIILDTSAWMAARSGSRTRCGLFGRKRRFGRRDTADAN